jgi:hypothetical protein
MPCRVDNSLQMNPGCSFRSLVRRWSLPAALVACALMPASALPLPAAGPDLSARLSELAKPAVRSAPRPEQAARLGLAVSGPGSLLRDGGRVLVNVRLDGDDVIAAAAGLRAAGAEVVYPSRRYRTITAAVRPAALRRVGSLARVAGVTEVLTPVVRGVDCGGAVRAEGDQQLNAANARASFGVDGSGVTVGILSDSFNRDPLAATHAPEDVLGGDLPGPGSPCGSTTPVGVLDDSFAKGDDEGRAMAQIVHDLAPGAAIDFATAFTGEFQFADNIRALAAAGARVIADDVAYPEEPFFQDGPVAVAINDVVGAGASYFSAAGNDNLVDVEGNDIASWEAPAFRDSGACPAAILTLSGLVEEQEEDEGVPVPAGLNPSHCMDFDPGPLPLEADDSFGITVEKSATLLLDLQWAEPWGGVETDLDAFLLDAVGNPLEEEGFVVGSIERNVANSQRPFEFLKWTNEGPEQTVQLVVNRFAPDDPSTTNTPRLKFVLLQNGGGVSAVERPKSSGGDTVGPSVYGHAGAAAAMSVGAIRFNAVSAPEQFSSRGPVTHYFGPAVSAAPAAPLPTPPPIPKPDFIATDGTANTFFGPVQGGVHRFYGTSAAAPHAAAVAALVRQANPTAGAAQVRAALTATAKPVGSFGPDAVGSGLIDAYGAVQALALPPTVTITKAPEPLSRNRQPVIEFRANRPVAFSCAIDGGPAQPCASPFGVPTPLGDGSHGIAVRGVDLAGRAGNSGTVSFTIDTRPPTTSIARHPRKLIRTRKRTVRTSFRFRSDDSAATFVCKVDRGLLRFCGPRLARRFAAGKHVLQVRARDAAGNVDRSPAVFRFRVERIR